MFRFLPLFTDAMLAHVGWRAQIGFVAAFNTLIAVVLTLVTGDHYGEGTFWRMLVISHSIGFSIFASGHLVLRLRRRWGTPQRWDMVVAIVLGAVAGSLLGALLTGTLEATLAAGSAGIGKNVLLGIIFGAAATHYFISRARIAQSELDVQQQEMRRLTTEVRLAETQLRLLQAQIEPHFLFNTLSNIHSLIETRPERAARMLESLTQLLRASLKRTRDEATTLGDELTLVRAYLAIQQERMGERLAFAIEAADESLALPFPPLLIQPLVENAVQHGLEPSVQGGAVQVRIERVGERLHIEVSDTGAGVRAGSAGHGLGLANVRERLASLYGAGAELRLAPGHMGGMTAALSLPLRRALELRHEP